MIIKFGYYYKHKIKNHLIMIHGIESGSRESFYYSSRLDLVCPYWHWYGISADELLEEYVEYNP